MKFVRREQTRAITATRQEMHYVSHGATGGRSQIRHYEGGAINRLTASQENWPIHPDVITVRDQRRLVARSRQQVANNDYAKRFLSLLKTNVVGPDGIRLVAMPTDDAGAVDEGEKWAIEHAFEEWCRAENCDITGRMSFKEMCEQFVCEMAMDGEALTLLIYGELAGPWGMGLQVVDPQRIDLDLRTNLANGDFVRFGIQFNLYGRPKAYKILMDNMNGVYGTLDSAVPAGDGQLMHGRIYQTMPADQVIHDFLTEQVGQRRGIPWFGTSMLRMQMLSGLEDAAVTAARVGAARSGFLKPNEDAEPDAAPDELPVDVADPGAWINLPKGFDYQSNDAQYPSGEYAEFHKSILKGTASGLGPSYFSLASDLEGVSYSSIRQGVLEERDWYKALQNRLADKFCRRVFEQWLPRALLSGLIVSRTGVPLPAENLAKYMNHKWQGKRWSWVDPSKEVSAARDSVDGRLRSRSDIIREQGRDPDEVFEELGREQKRLEELGIPAVSELAPGGPAKPGAEDDDDAPGAKPAKPGKRQKV